MRKCHSCNLDVSRINSCWCRKLQHHSRSHKHHDLSPDDSFSSLSTEMVEISGLEVRVFSLDYRERMTRLNFIETLTPKKVFIGFLLRLSDLSPPTA